MFRFHVCIIAGLEYPVNLAGLWLTRIDEPRILAAYGVRGFAQGHYPLGLVSDTRLQTLERSLDKA